MGREGDVQSVRTNKIGVSSNPATAHAQNVIALEITPGVFGLHHRQEMVDTIACVTILLYNRYAAFSTFCKNAGSLHDLPA